MDVIMETCKDKIQKVLENGRHWNELKSYLTHDDKKNKWDDGEC